MRHTVPPAPPGCSGGLCLGMHGGPHEGGPASYPVGDVDAGFTRVSSTMTVPDCAAADSPRRERARR